MTSIILLIVALFLDGFLSIIIPLNYPFLPLITVTTIYIIYPIFKKKQKKYLLITFMVGILYDLLYTNQLLFNAIIFTTIAYITIYFYKTYQQTKITKIIYLIMIIILYEIITASILFVFQVTSINIARIVYKILYSILLNIIYAIILNNLLIKES